MEKVGWSGLCSEQIDALLRNDSPNGAIENLPFRLRDDLIVRGLVVRVDPRDNNGQWGSVPSPFGKQLRAEIESAKYSTATETLSCGCVITKGWRCPVHDGP